MEPADDGAVYQCRVDNNVGSEQSAQTQQLDVHCEYNVLFSWDPSWRPWIQISAQVCYFSNP